MLTLKRTSVIAKFRHTEGKEKFAENVMDMSFSAVHSNVAIIASALFLLISKAGNAILFCLQFHIPKVSAKVKLWQVC